MNNGGFLNSLDYVFFSEKSLFSLFRVFYT